MQNQTELENAMDEFREKVAAHCHKQWSGWMEYLFANSFYDQDGTVIIPKWAADRWERQKDAEYKDLPEAEKDNDRKEADEFIHLFKDRVS